MTHASARRALGERDGTRGVAPAVWEGGAVPLSEEEQRILHEMERNLYEHDRAFVDRVRSEGPHSMARRSARWAVAMFVAGLVILLVSFRSSLLLGTFGFVVMLLAALAFEHSARQALGSGSRPARIPGRTLGAQLSQAGARLRDRSKRWRGR